MPAENSHNGKFLFEIGIFVLKYVLDHSQSIPTKKFRPKSFVFAIFSTCDPVFSKKWLSSHNGIFFEIDIFVLKYVFCLPLFFTRVTFQNLKVTLGKYFQILSKNHTRVFGQNFFRFLDKIFLGGSRKKIFQVFRKIYSKTFLV